MRIINVTCRQREPQLHQSVRIRTGIMHPTLEVGPDARFACAGRCCAHPDCTTYCIALITGTAGSPGLQIVLSSSAPLPHGRSSGPAMCPPTRRYPEGLDAPIELSAKVRGSRRARPLRASAAQRAGRGWCYSKITRLGERVLMPWSHRGRCLAMRPGCIRLSTCLDEPPVPPL